MLGVVARQVFKAGQFYKVKVVMQGFQDLFQVVLSLHKVTAHQEALPLSDDFLENLFVFVGLFDSCLAPVTLLSDVAELFVLFNELIVLVGEKTVLVFLCGVLLLHEFLALPCKLLLIRERLLGILNFFLQFSVHVQQLGLDLLDGVL